jgi:Undecaprenyl-phosphate galactose phosphotransferase WbaP
VSEPTGPVVAGLSVLKVRLSKLVILLGDVLAISMAFLFSVWVCMYWKVDTFPYATSWWGGQDTSRLIAWGVICLLGLVMILMKFQHYSDRRPFWDELLDFSQLVGLLSLLDIAAVATVQWNASRIWWALSWFMVLCLLVVFRIITRYVLRKLQIWTRPTIIIGVGPNAAEAALALHSQPEMGLQVCCFVDTGGDEQAIDERTQPRIAPSKVAQMTKQPGIQWVIALEHSQAERREYWLRQLAKWGMPDVAVIPAMRGVPLHGTDITHFFSHEVALLRMRNNLRRWPARLTKRIFDTLAAIVLLAMLSPFMLLIAYLIRRDGGPAWFAHPRIGQKGAVFNCLKFRTMVVDAEMQLERLLQRRPDLRRQWQNDRKLKQDPRVSPIGRFLRRTSLDELPQLINVIKGEMSLVGPRPVVRTELKKYGPEVVYYLMVRPGITGLWQVSGRNDVDYETRVYLDTWYVKNWALWYDLKILIQTLRVVLKRDGAY